MTIASYTITHNGLTEGTLEETLENLNEFADYICVVVSADSDDGTRKFVAEKYENGEVDSYTLEHYDFPEEESKIRKLGYEAALSHDPDWVAAIDDDEIIPQPKKTKRKMLAHKDVDFAAADFYHMWEEDKFRADGTWRPGEIKRIIFQNLQTDWQGEYSDADIHSGRLPIGQGNKEPKIAQGVPVIHYGWYKEQEKREEKMEKKRENDDIEGKDTEYANTQREHYNSVYEEPTLMELPGEFQNWMI